MEEGTPWAVCKGKQMGLPNRTSPEVGKMSLKRQGWGLGLKVGNVKKKKIGSI